MHLTPSRPVGGAVLGVDVGFSPKRRSSAVCRLDWTSETVTWTIARFAAVEPERTTVLHRLADRPLLAAAFDGPLARGLEVIGHYRAAERMLTRRVGRHIGKPGSSGAPVGKLLNAASNACAIIVRGTGHVATATHPEAIDDTAIVEAFPGAALGLTIAEPGTLTVRRGDRTDVFFKHLTNVGALDDLVARLLPGRRLAASFGDVTDHDGRAGLVCALTALGLATRAHTAVGGDDGWIILPPRAAMAPWAWPMLEANAADGAGHLVDAAAMSS